MGRGKTKFMPDNDKREMLSFLLFLEKQSGEMNWEYK